MPQVLKAHTRVFHIGIKETLTEVRTRYWILKGRLLVKRILRKCLMCKRFEERPTQLRNHLHGQTFESKWIPHLPLLELTLLGGCM